MKKRLFSLLLACIMLFSLLPISLANEGDDDVPESTTETETVIDSDSANVSEGQTEQSNAPSNGSANEEGEQEPEAPSNEPEQEAPVAGETDGSDAPADEQPADTLIDTENGSAEEDADEAPQPVEIALSLNKLKDVRIENGAAEFVVKAACNQADVAIIYQWQQLDTTDPFSAIEDETEWAAAREAAWRDMRKATSNQLSFTGIEDFSTVENLLFRCRVSTGDVVVYTEEVKLLPEEKQAAEPVQPETATTEEDDLTETPENTSEDQTEVSAEGSSDVASTDPEIVDGQVDDEPRTTETDGESDAVSMATDPVADPSGSATEPEGNVQDTGSENNEPGIEQLEAESTETPADADASETVDTAAVEGEDDAEPTADEPEPTENNLLQTRGLKSALAAPQTRSAYSGQCGDNAYWRIENEVLTIYGTGAVDDGVPYWEYSNPPPWNDWIREEEDYTSTSPRKQADSAMRFSKAIIEDGITDIYGAFDFCDYLEEVIIPASVTEADAFYGTHRLTTAGPIGGNYNIQFGWTTNIPEDAFSDSSLQSITLPATITKIGDWAFYGCDALTDVYYGGTREQAAKIKVAEENEALLNATWHYNSAGPEDTLAGIDKLDSQLAVDSKYYNNELAIIAAELCLASYTGGSAHDSDCDVRSYLFGLGFSDSNIYSNNYGGSLAFTVATKPYIGPGSDGNTDVLVIVAQGTTNGYERLQDIASGHGEIINGYETYDVVRDFHKDIIDGIKKLTNPGKNYKAFVTGHSLGGAAANLVGATLTRGYYGRENVHCYTFAALDCIVQKSLVYSGYENIHNVYNKFDTFSLYQYGYLLQTGMGKMCGKFGELNYFIHDFRTAEEARYDFAGQIASSINHKIENYIYAAKSGEIAANRSRWKRSLTVIGCPVDVTIYRDNVIIGQIKSNVVETASSEVEIIIESDMKFIIYPDNQLYKLELSSYDNGEMQYSTYDPKAGGVHSFSNVNLSKGKTFHSEIGGTITAKDVKLYVVDDKGEPVREVQEDGTETEIVSPTATISFLAEGDPVNGWVEVDGVPYEVVNGTITIPADLKASVITQFTYNKVDEDPHQVYPTGMKVWFVENVDGASTAKRVADLDNVLRYAGSSIRITGKKGIRMITSLDKSLKAKLISAGVSGYTLLEYGTVVAWVSELNGGALTLDHPAAKQAYAYKKGVADPIFKDANGLVQYTNVLVGLTNEKCVPDLAMRPYMILQSSTGAKVVICGGTIQRSIGYIAYQNRKAFQPGTASYAFIWDIIHFVYGTKYDADYKK